MYINVFLTFFSADTAALSSLPESQLLRQERLLGESLAKYWKSYGFPYSTSDAVRTKQCLVTLINTSRRVANNNNGSDNNLQGKLVYPTDKVYRLDAGVYMPPKSHYTPEAMYPWSKPFRLSIRDAFIATKGCTLLSADYKQIELRVMAHLSKDPKLIEIFNGATSDDVFQMLASSWLDKGISTITSTERKQAKEVREH